MSEPSTKNEWMFEAMASRRRIAELEAEVARLRAQAEMVDANMEDESAPTWSAEIRLPPSDALAAAYERGAREFASYLNDVILANPGPDGTSLPDAVARFLTSRGTGIAESKGG